MYYYNFLFLACPTGYYFEMLMRSCTLICSENCQANTCTEIFNATSFFCGQCAPGRSGPPQCTTCVPGYFANNTLCQKCS